MLTYIFIATLSIALLSLVGSFFFNTKDTANKTHTFVLPVAVGVFLGVVFFELLPETYEASHVWGPVAIACGFFGFYILSHMLHTFHHHHAHDEDSCVGTGGKMLLIGDAIHNVADGVVIASAFMVNPLAGVVTTVGIALHEIPQEIAEFGVLLRSGYSRQKARVLNFISATSVFVGALFTYFFAQTTEGYVFVLTGIAAGNLLYIASADLIPELRESHKEHFAATLVATLAGFVLIGGLISYTHENLPEYGNSSEEFHDL